MPGHTRLERRQQIMHPERDTVGVAERYRLAVLKLVRRQHQRGLGGEGRGGEGRPGVGSNPRLGGVEVVRQQGVVSRVRL